MSVVATGIDDEAVITQSTIVPNARRASDGYAGPMAPRRNLGDSANGAFVGDPREASDDDAYGDFETARPTFSREEIEADRRKAASGNGFSLFGWMGGKAPEAPPPREPRRPPPEPSAENDALDEELEIPAFLRRQMTQR